MEAVAALKPNVVVGDLVVSVASHVEVVSSGLVVVTNDNDAVEKL